MADSFLSARLDALRKAQNPDGGWGYFPGKQSWLEPTVYAALALHGDPASDRAWELLRSWQSEDGSWRPSKTVQVASWGTALCVTLAITRGEFGEPFQKGVAHLLATTGQESSLGFRVRAKIAVMIGQAAPDHDLSLKGWPWKPDTSAWVEPTSHTLVALKKAAKKLPTSEVKSRIRSGEDLLLSVQCKEGGWNYGNRTVLQVDLPAYPETSALALLGLQGRSGLGKPIDLATQWVADTTSPLARAWLTIALRLHDVVVPNALPENLTKDSMIIALEALGAPEGNYNLLRTEEIA